MRARETEIAGDGPAREMQHDQTLAEITEIEQPDASDTVDSGDTADAAADGRANGSDGAAPRPQLPSDRYLDREQSWVQFNERVL